MSKPASLDELRSSRRKNSWDEYREYLEHLDQQKIDQNTQAARQVAAENAVRDSQTTTVTSGDTLQRVTTRDWTKRVGGTTQVARTTVTAFHHTQPSPAALMAAGRANGGAVGPLQFMDAKLVDFTRRGSKAHAPGVMDLIKQRAPLTEQASATYNQWASVVADRAAARATSLLEPR